MEKLKLAEMCPKNIIEVVEEALHNTMVEVKEHPWAIIPKLILPISCIIGGFLILFYNMCPLIEIEERKKINKKAMMRNKLRKLY